MSPETIEKTVHAYFNAINTLDCDAWLATFAPNATSHEPGVPPLTGHDALRQYFNGVAGGFSSINFTAREIFPVGAEAAVKWDARGTGHNGKETIFAGIDIFAFNDSGQIQTIHAYWNPAAMMAQLQ